MQPFATLLTFLVLALTLTLSTAAPHAQPLYTASDNAGDLVNTTVPNTIDDSNAMNDTANINSQNKCYDWDTSEKWKDVGGQHSDFVNQAVYDLCQLIAIEAYKGFPSGNTFKHCKEVRAGSHGGNYDRSIGISLRYMGPQLKFSRLTAGYCNDRMAQPTACGAGGEFDERVDNPDLPNPWVSDRWEAKADPNRGNCRANRYSSDL